METVKIRHTACALLALVLLTNACRDDRAPRRRKKPDPTTASNTPRPRDAPPLAAWLRRVPADAPWAVVSADLGRLRAAAADLTALLNHHPRLAPEVRQWRTELERKWGGWPLAPKTWAELGLTPGSGGAMYRRADGAMVLLFRAPRLHRVLKAIDQAMLRRRARPRAALKRITIAGRPAFRINGWTCVKRDGVCTCADLPPARFAPLTRPPGRNLWRAHLAAVDHHYLRERLGIWLAAKPGGAPELIQAVGKVFNRSPRGLWLATSLGRRLQLHAVAVALAPPTPPSKQPSPAILPKPGHSGLAATGAAPLVVRLRLSPQRLGEHAQRLVPDLKPLLDLLRTRQVGGETLGQEMLNGEVVLMSEHAGVAAILGVRNRARGQRAMKKLMLLLAPRLASLQKQVRARGRGWDLSYARTSLGDVPTHRLILQVPPKAGPGSPRLRDGRLTLHWGLTRRHIVVATDANLFRRTLAGVSRPDSQYLRRLPDADARRGFAEHALLSAYVQPDDPADALPRRQRAAVQRWLTELGPRSRQWAHRIRTLVDLTDNATLTCNRLAVGIGCHLGISLLIRPGPGDPSKRTPTLRLDAQYRQALIMKWGGNHNGHLRRLSTLATATGASPLRAKAGRIMAHRRGVDHAGLEGLLVSVWLPWARHRLVIAARQEAPRELHRLSRALQRLADRARGLPMEARRRWYRGLRSTRITPIRSCCVGGVRRCTSRSTDWSHPTWRRLGFSVQGPHLYRYQLTLESGSLRSRLVLRALGDLNCNGRSSLMQRVGTIDAATGALKLGPITRARKDD